MVSGKMFTVIEYHSFFAIRHNPSGRERVLGDGVDMLFDCDGIPISPGTPEFVELLEMLCNSDIHETLEAYFSDSGVDDTHASETE